MKWSACLVSFIHHVSGHEVDVEGEKLIIKYVHTKLESKFLVKTGSFDYADIWSLELQQ